MSGTKHYKSSYCKRYTANGGHAAKRFESAVLSIPAWRQRLRQVTVLCTDMMEVLSRIEDAPGNLIYVDPPYLVKDSPYKYDPDNLPGRWGWLRWHLKLRNILNRFHRARVVVSYYDHPYLARMYSGWNRKSFLISKSITNPRKIERVNVVATEVLLVNGPILETPAQSRLFG